MKSLYDDLKRNGNRNIIQEFESFRQNFTGDPKAEVERLLQSGKMSQGDLDRLQAMAREFQALVTYSGKG